MATSDERIQKLISSPLFPFMPDLSLKQLSPLMEAEFPRDGEGGRPCHACEKPERALWTNGRWQITSFQATANPVQLFLETVEHLDFETLDKEMAAELGVLTWRLEAAIRSLDSVGRVHINRWGDGSSHFTCGFRGGRRSRSSSTVGATFYGRRSTNHFRPTLSRPTILTSSNVSQRHSANRCSPEHTSTS